MTRSGRRAASGRWSRPPAFATCVQAASTLPGTSTPAPEGRRRCACCEAAQWLAASRTVPLGWRGRSNRCRRPEVLAPDDLADALPVMETETQGLRRREGSPGERRLDWHPEQVWVDDASLGQLAAFERHRDRVLPTGRARPRGGAHIERVRCGRSSVARRAGRRAAGPAGTVRRGNGQGEGRCAAASPHRRAVAKRP